MKNTKIDWADSTWNPVTGCLHSCKYCYARRIAERFGGLTPSNYGETQELEEPGKTTDGKTDVYPFGFLPTFHRYMLNRPQHWKKPRTIFVCSMADLFGEWVPDEWIREVFEACAAAPQHRYLFLTKNPQRYNVLYRCKPPYLENAMFGYTLDPNYTQNLLENTVLPYGEDVFISIEPITEPLNANYMKRIEGCGWVIVGAETGNRKGKVIPRREWVEGIAEACSRASIPIFMKGSLRGLMGAGFRQEYPWGGGAS